MNEKREVKVIYSPIIENPQEDCIYELVAKSNPSEKAIIELSGKTLTSLASLNIETMSWITRSGKMEQAISDTVVNGKIISFNVSTESLPPNTESAYPILIFNDGNRFHVVDKRTFDFDNKMINNFSTKLGTKLQPDNQRIEGECQKLARNIPVRSGLYPIFLSVRRPSRAFLFKLHRNFWNYNKARLEEQVELSKARCFLRAHLITIILSLYGIDSVKVFKLWRITDWNNSKKPYQWKYHCATLIIDADNNKWVWDTWIDNNRYLLPLSLWLRMPDTPIPRLLLIANRAVIGDYRRGLEATLSFSYAHEIINFSIFQRLITSALPNPPDQTIPFRHTFFKKVKPQPGEHDSTTLSTNVVAVR